MLVHAQAPAHMESLSVKDGLSQGFVTSMLQDKRGFMWFGTYDGLNRYDGYNVRRYTSKPFDQWSLQSSYITRLYEDDRELLWVGTHYGLYVFDPQTERFFNLSTAEYRLPPNTVENIRIDRYGTVFVQFPSENNRVGLYVLHLPSDFLHQLREKAPKLSGIVAEPLKSAPDLHQRANLTACIGDTMPVVIDGLERIFGYSQAKQMLLPLDLKTLPSTGTDADNFLWSKYHGYFYRRKLPDGRDSIYPPSVWYPVLPFRDIAKMAHEC